MKINKLSLKNYRNIQQIDTNFGDVNIIYGENAQGKTNLIEAIYLFSGAKSFRNAHDSQLIKFGENSAEMKIEFESSNRTQNAKIVINDNSKKEVYLNGVSKKSVSSLSDEIKAVVFSPVHLNLIKGGPAERRKFIDGALSQMKYTYSSLISNYNKSLKQRNMLLKKLSVNANEKTAVDMLYVWNKNIAFYGAKIVNQRMKYIQAITPYAVQIFKGISSGRENIEIKYSSQIDFGDDVKENESRIFDLCEKNTMLDIQNNITSAGPHRDDIEILINSKSARLYGSQGQQRSCVLALKLAEASLLNEITGEKPIALLDDVMSELDSSRQDYVLNHIKDWQIFITCCDKDTVLRLKSGKTFHIKDGKIQ